jgi:hypothetical protein
VEVRVRFTAVAKSFAFLFACPLSFYENGTGDRLAIDLIEGGEGVRFFSRLTTSALLFSEISCRFHQGNLVRLPSQ